METALNKEKDLKTPEISTGDKTIREVALALAAKDKEQRGENGKKEEKTSSLIMLGSSRLPQALRWLGTTALVVAAMIYMIQGVSLANTMERHWAFFVITAILGGLGVYFGLAAREVKGGRTFLGIAAASVPVHFSQLGGMIHSLVGEAPANMPEALVFSATSAAATAATAAATIGLLAPLTYFCFSIYGRSRALPLTIVYFLTNAAILIPMRGSGIVAAVIVLTAAMIRGADYYFFTDDARLKSFEGTILRCMFGTIILTLIGRSLFYPMGAPYFSMLLAAGGLALFFDLPRFLEQERSRAFLQAAGSLMICNGWILFSAYRVKPIAIPSNDIYFIFLPVAALLYALSHFSQASRAYTYRFAASVAALVTLTGYQFASATPLTSLVTFIGGSLLISLGIAHAEKGPFISGIAAAAAGLSHHLQFAFDLYTQNLWVSLSITGICTLILASFFEMKGERLQGFINRYRTRIRSWH